MNLYDTNWPDIGFQSGKIQLSGGEKNIILDVELRDSHHPILFRPGDLREKFRWRWTIQFLSKLVERARDFGLGSTLGRLSNPSILDSWNTAFLRADFLNLSMSLLVLIPSDVLCGPLYVEELGDVLEIMTKGLDILLDVTVM